MGLIKPGEREEPFTAPAADGRACVVIALRELPHPDLGLPECVIDVRGDDALDLVFDSQADPNTAAVAKAGAWEVDSVQLDQHGWRAYLSAAAGGLGCGTILRAPVGGAAGSAGGTESASTIMGMDQQAISFGPTRTAGSEGVVVAYLPALSDLEQLRRQAKDLLHEATRRAAEAVASIDAISDRVTLASAQLAIAREYLFAS